MIHNNYYHYFGDDNNGKNSYERTNAVRILQKKNTELLLSKQKREVRSYLLQLTITDAGATEDEIFPGGNI